MPRSSPWGTVDYIKPILRGVAILNTPSHGGLALSKGFAKKNLSESALKRGQIYGGYYHYEEDCAFCIPAFELLRKDPTLVYKLFYDPDKLKTVEQRLLEMKQSLSSWNPNYLLEIGETPLEPQYSSWKEWELHEKMRVEKNPNLIVSATGRGDDIVEIWTADDKEHFVIRDSYRQSVVNLLSNCVIIPDSTLAELLKKDNSLSESDKKAIDSYLSQNRILA